VTICVVVMSVAKDTDTGTNASRRWHFDAQSDSPVLVVDEDAGATSAWDMVDEFEKGAM
jgi:hypothetical protein